MHFRTVDVRVESERGAFSAFLSGPLGGLEESLLSFASAAAAYRSSALSLQAQRLYFRQKREILGAHFVA